MAVDLLFVVNSVGLGVGLAMDAFSVCIANGLKEPDMSRQRHIKMAGIYAFFQFLMPMAGWICVHTIQKIFASFQKFVPWIALILLLYIGGGMLLEGIRNRNQKEDEKAEKSDNSGNNSANNRKISLRTLIIQGVATSIDALSVGFTIADYEIGAAFSASLIIAFITLIICIFGVKLGKVFGVRLRRYADILGGTILIAIGIEIFIKGFI